MFHFLAITGEHISLSLRTSILTLKSRPLDLTALPKMDYEGGPIVRDRRAPPSNPLPPARFGVAVGNR